ncbi:MAG: cytochrome P450 [Actinomycetota bacterium]
MIDLDSPESLQHPTGYFDRARAAGAVQWSDIHRAWVVIDHAEVASAFRDSVRLSADRIGPLERAAAPRPAAFGRVVDLLRGWMVFRDPPHHTRLRDPVRNTFTPRRVDALSPIVSGVVDDVVASLAPGEIDVRREFAGPLPALVVAAVLGVDGEDRLRFQRWSDDLADVVFSTTPSTIPTDEAIEATEEFTRFFEPLIEAERRSPSGSLLGHLVAEADSELDTMELVGACTLLLFAGHETTTSLLTNVICLLMEQPVLLDELRGRPGIEDTAIEEFLRVLGPTRTMFRKALSDHERGGALIHEGDTVALAMVAANHDRTVFSQPEIVDLARTPNPHLTFGWGLHHCVGAHLARLEAKLALRALLARFTSLEAAAPMPPRTGAVMAVPDEPVRIRASGEQEASRS